jgi:predicted nuclease with RNAse H fold
LPSDLTLQEKNAYEIALLSESQKLGLEAVSGDSSVRKYRILKTVDQLPTDKPLSFSDYQFIGNIKNSLRSHGYTVLPQ